MFGDENYFYIWNGEDFLGEDGDLYGITVLDANGNEININGDDTITNYTKNTVVTGTDDADSIKNYAGGVKIYANDGNDYIYNSTSSDYTINNSWGYVTIDAGAGNDTIYSYDPYVSISGGAGNDYIYGTNFSYVTINGGSGNDTIYAGSGSYKIYQYASGDGNDIIYDFTENDTLQISGAASYTTTKSGSNLIVGVGTGSITVNGGANVAFKIQTVKGGDTGVTVSNSTANTVINGTAYADSIYNSGDSVKIDAGAGNDTVYNDGYHASIDLGDGADSIYNNGSSYVTINGGAGNDTLEGIYYYSTINGGAGADTISGYYWNSSISGGADADTISLGSSGFYNTINGGTGNDVIYAPTSGTHYYTYQYANGDGNDTITGLDSNDTLHITSGYMSSSSISGNDVILTIGTGKITLKDAKGQSFYLKTGSSSASLVSFGDEIDLPLGWKLDSTKGLLQATVASAENEIDLNEDYGDGVKSIDGSKITSGVYIYGNDLGNSIKGGKGADLILGGAGNDTVSLGGGADTYIYTSGNDLIQDYTAGADSIQIDISEIEIYGVSTVGSNVIIETSNGNITVKGGNGKDIVLVDEYGDRINLGPEIPYGWQLTNNILKATVASAENEIDLNEDYGAEVEKVDASKISGGAYIYGNDLNNSIKGGKGADTIFGGAGNDTVSLGAGADTYIYSGGDDLIQDYATVDVIQIDTENGVEVTNIETVSSNVIIETSEGNITVKGGKDKNIALIDSDGNDINPEPDDLYILGTSGADNINNDLDNATIDALAGNDTISNGGDSVSISAGDGNDIVSNTGVSMTAYGGAGNDSIYNNASYGKIYAGDGADTVYSDEYGDISYIDAGVGNDSIYGEFNDYSTINGGAGNDIILDYGSAYSSIYGGADNDLISVKSVSDFIYGHTIQGGTGNDTIYSNSLASASSGGSIYQYANGDGNDVIYGLTSYDTLHITSGSISNSQASGSDVLVTVGSGVMTLKGAAGKTVYLKKGTASATNVTLPVSVNPYLIEGTSGADKITNSISGSTIYGYAGNDSISNSYQSVKVYAGDGNDSIYNTGNYTTIYGGAGNDKVYNYDDNHAYVDLGDGDDSIYAYDNDYVTLDAGAGKDTVTGDYWSSKVNGGAGNDLLNITSYNSTINAGDGDDTINLTNYGSINGGTGNDRISLGSYSSSLRTVTGGAGNDTIYGDSISSNGGIIYQYASGDGNDYLYGLKSTDTLHITSGSISNSQASGSDVLITVGSGVMTLKGAAGKTVYLKKGTASAANVTLPVTVNPYPAGISVSGATLTATTAFKGKEIDIADYDGVTKVNAASLSSGVSIIGDSSANSIKGGKGADVIAGGAGNDTVSLGGGNDTYIYSGGNDLIQDYTAGQDKIKLSGVSITGAEDKNSNVIFSMSNGGKISVKGGEGKEITIIDSKGTVITYPTVNPYPTGWKFANTLASATLTSADDLDLTEAYGEGVIKVDGSKLTSGVYIYGNSLNNSIKGGKGADVISGGAGNDTVSLGGGNDTYIYSGGNDSIQDYKAGQDVIKFETAIQSASVNSSNNLIIKTAKGNVTVIKGKDTAVSVIDSNNKSFTIENIYPVPDPDTLPAGWKYANTAKTSITATLTSADDLDLTEDYGEGVIKVDGSKTTSGVVIYGNSLNNSIKGGKGADVIAGDSGNDTVSLGGGNDTYIYSGGNDSIQDYTAGQDVIKFETAIQSATVNGSNLVITTSAGKVTVAKGQNKNVRVIDSSGDAFTIYNEYSTVKPNPDTVITLTDNADNETYSDDNVTVDALKGHDKISVEGNYISINAGEGNDKITIEYGAEEVTIYGGKGNDQITNNQAANTVYEYATGDGNDIIIGYNENDSVVITKGSYSYDVSGNDFIITVGNGKITLKDSAKKTVTIVDERGISETISPITPLPDGWTYDKTKTKVTATRSADNYLDLTESYGDGVEVVDASKINGDVEIYAHDNGVSIKSGGQADSITGGAGNDIVSLGAGKDSYVYNGGDDIFQDYAEGYDVIRIDIDGISADNASQQIQRSTNGADIVYTLKNNQGTLTVKNAANKKIAVIDSNDNEIIFDELPSGWKYGNSDKTLVTATIKSAQHIDLTEGYGEGVISVNAALVTDAIEIIGNGLNNSISGGKGADTIHGGEGNDIISLGNGADTYIYSGGDDTITDYASVDVIQIDNNEINFIDIDDSKSTEVVYYTDNNGTLTIKKSGNKKINADEITILDENGDKYTITPAIPDGWSLNSAKNKLTATVAAPSEAEIDLTKAYGDGVVSVDASKVTSGVEIYCNDLGNYIKGSKSGGATIYGGDGNDTVSLGGGADVYIYQGGGDDTILNYATVDAIKFDTDNININSIKATVSGSDIIYNIKDVGKLTVKKGNGKNITLIDSNDEEFTLSTSSKNVAENIWFLEDDNNFVASDIDSITENKFTVTEIQNYNNEDFAQDDNILTFAKEK